MSELSRKLLLCAGLFLAFALATLPILSYLTYSHHLALPLQSAAAEGEDKGTVTINGAGATFPFPLIDTWRNEYQKVDPAVNINYQSIGSGGGIKQFIEKTVDFGASDAPLSSSEREQAPNSVHIPETIGSIVISYNLPSMPHKGLKLSGPVLADIFLGKIRKWNDPPIASLNPGIYLPDASILVVHRSDGSGTTFVWTGYLSKVSPEWSQKIGASKSVQWPTGIGASGNEGVANTIKGNSYTIGYIELSYALSTKMPYAFLQNKEGNFIEPSFDSIKAAISSSTPALPKGSESWSDVSTTNAEGKDSYPIASFSYLLLYKELADNPSIDSVKAKAIIGFISWAITEGQKYSASLGYVPLPDEVVKVDQETLRSITFHGQPLSSTTQLSASSSSGQEVTRTMAPTGALSDDENNNDDDDDDGLSLVLMVVGALASVGGIAVIVALRKLKSRKGTATSVQEPATGLTVWREQEECSCSEKDEEEGEEKNAITTATVAASAAKTRNFMRKDAISSILLRRSLFGDRIFRVIVVGTAGYTVFLMILVAYSAFAGSAEAFSKEGFIDFVIGTNWNAVEGRESYGAFPYIVGTLASSGIAMAIGVPISVGIATFVSEKSPRRFGTPLSFVVELLAAVPSIIYGLWALFVFRFWIKDLVEAPLHQLFGDTLPIFAKTPFGLDIFTAGVVLAIMIIPTVSSVAREVMRAVPNSQREAAYSLGATRWEAVRTAVFPSARSGLLGASVLGLGRAVGETMLVTMVIGNAIGLAAIPGSLFSPSQTLASLIANEFNEAVTSFHTSALIALGAVLFLLTIAINVGARLMVSRIITITDSSRRTKSAGMGGKGIANRLQWVKEGQYQENCSSPFHRLPSNCIDPITSANYPQKQKGIGEVDDDDNDEDDDNVSSSVTIATSRSRAYTQQAIRALLHSDSSKRKIVNVAITFGALACVIAAIVPLGSILLEVVKNGAQAISFEFITQPPGSLGSGEGGIGPAIQGTLIVVGLASAIGAPVGVLAGIYLSEYAGSHERGASSSISNRFAYFVRFFNDVLTGLPSIVVGIVGYVALVLTIGSFSVWAGAFALSIIMIPVVVRVTEETLKIVPDSIREAAHSLGIPRWKIALFIVLPAAKNGILTGVVLAVSRIMGETAPLIMTILGTSLFFTGFSGPVDALPLRIWRLASQPYESAHSFGWGAALILILIVLALSVGLRLASRRYAGRGKTHAALV